MIRWKFVVPVVIITAAICVFVTVFLDAFLRRGFIAAGQMAAGARVEISSVKTRFKDLSITIKGVAVAQRTQEFTDLVTFDAMRFSVQPLPLLSRKVIINDMSVEGLRWGTKRERSGKLPPRVEKKFVKKQSHSSKPGFADKMIAGLKAKGSAELRALPAADALSSLSGGIKDLSVSSLVSAADLSSLREIDAMKAEISSRYQSYQAELSTVDVEKPRAALNAAVAAVQGLRIQSVADIEPAKARLDTLNAARADLEKSYAQVKTLQQRFSTDWDASLSLAARVQDLINADIKSVQAKLHLPQISFDNATRALFGPVWIGRVETVMKYVALVRRFFPPKEKGKTVRPRLKGRDISFPLKETPPSFLISNMSLSGSSGGPGKTGVSVDFSGVIRNITSEPEILGMPTTLALSGDTGVQQFILNGIFDHTGDIPRDSLTARVTGIRTRDLGIPPSAYTPSFERGSAVVTATITLTGQSMDSRLDLTASGISYSTTTPAGMNEEVARTVRDLWAGITIIQVSARITGTEDKLDTSISSSLDSILSDRLKKIFGARVAEATARVRAEVDRLTAQKKAELMNEFNARKAELTAQYSSRLAQGQQQLDAARSQVDQKKAEIQAQLDGEKKKAEDALKKQAENKLKEFIKF